MVAYREGAQRQASKCRARNDREGDSEEVALSNHVLQCADDLHEEQAPVGGIQV